MGDQDLEHRDQRPWARLCFNPRRHDSFSSVREHQNVSRLVVWRGVLWKTEIFAGCVVDAVDRHVTNYRPAASAPRSLASGTRLEPCVRVEVGVTEPPSRTPLLRHCIPTCSG